LEITDIFLSRQVLFIKYLLFAICSNIEKSTYNYIHAKLTIFHFIFTAVRFKKNRNV